MRTSTKVVLWGGVACAVLGPTLVAQAMVSTGYGTGEFLGVTVHKGIPALTQGLRTAGTDNTGGLFGEPAPGTDPLPSASKTPTTVEVPPPGTPPGAHWDNTTKQWVV
jgi:hypothetical protein